MSATMPAGWEETLAADLGAPSSDADFFDDWAEAEHGSTDGPWGGEDEGGEYNPFDTSLPESGATEYNAAGVENYPSEAVGLQATVSTLDESAYSQLLSDIRAGAPTEVLEEDVDSSPWGTQFSIGADGSSPASPSTSGSTTATTDSWETDIGKAVGGALGAALQPAEKVLLAGFLELTFVALGAALIVVGGFKMAGTEPSEVLGKLKGAAPDLEEAAPAAAAAA